MKFNGERTRRIYNWFGRTGRTKLRKAFLAEFGYHNQTFWNKLNPNYKTYYFGNDELAWLERYARENGMPESELNKNAEPQTAA